MIVNQANLHGLTVGYSTAFNKSFDTTQSNYQKVAKQDNNHKRDIHIREMGQRRRHHHPSD